LPYEPPLSLEEVENDGLRERVRIRVYTAFVEVLGDGGAVGAEFGGAGGGKKNDRPREDAILERRDGRGWVRTFRYMLKDRRALFAWGTYL